MSRPTAKVERDDADIVSILVTAKDSCRCILRGKLLFRSFKNITAFLSGYQHRFPPFLVPLLYITNCAAEHAFNASLNHCHTL
jgi:hypothetical protein